MQAFHFTNPSMRKDMFRILTNAEEVVDKGAEASGWTFYITGLVSLLLVVFVVLRNVHGH